MTNFKGKKIKALIDTGSEKSYISDKILPLHEIEVLKSALYIVQFANTEVSEVNEVTILKFQIESIDFEFDIKAGILKNNNEGIILGIDFMEKYNILINFRNKNLIIEKNTINFSSNEGKLWEEESDSLLVEKASINCRDA